MSNDQMRSQAEVNAAMQMIPSAWRKRWCKSQACACLGCVNGSGGGHFVFQGVKPVSEDEWKQWMSVTTETLPCGSVRISVQGITGTVSSHHLVEPKINQLKQSLKNQNEQLWQQAITGTRIMGAG
jgi:hypothetical protein